MAKRPDTLTPKARRTRQAIVNATLEIVSRSGSHAVNVMAVCKAAGIGRTSFYNYFDDSDILLGEIAEVAAKKIRERFEQLHTGRPRGLERLKACLEMIFDLAVNEPDTISLVAGIAQTHEAIPDLLISEIAAELKGHAAKTELSVTPKQISTDSRYLAVCVLALSQQLADRKIAASERPLLVARLLAAYQ